MTFRANTTTRTIATRIVAALASLLVSTLLLSSIVLGMTGDANTVIAAVTATVRA
jgi:hypothetical protein